MENFTYHISAFFALITLLAVFAFYKATHDSKVFLLIVSAWVFVQTGIALSGFYTETDAFPPRLSILILPPLMSIALVFLTKFGKYRLERIDIHLLIIIHVLRAPVELVTYWLYLGNAAPLEMTFSGGNLDILAGISAPVVYYYAMIKKSISWQVLVIWNLIGIGLIFNVALKSVLSAPFFFQTIAFDQPNIAMLSFPFVFLPGVIIPIMVCSHLIAIRNLLKANWVQTAPGRKSEFQFIHQILKTQSP